MVRDAVPDAVAPPPGHPRFPLFDSFRGIGALMVLVAHTTAVASFPGAVSPGVQGALQAHLGVAMTIFFLVSGFLIYRPFVAARVRGAPRIRTADFARRRFLRIAPAYWVALTGLAIVPGLAGVFSGNWWVYYGLLWDYYPIYDPASECSQPLRYCGIAQGWSLGVEVAFYAMLPFFAALMGRWSAARGQAGWVRRELTLLTILSALSVVVRIWGTRGDPDTFWLVATLPANFFWIALGMALAILSVALEGRENERRWTRMVIERPWVLWAGALALYVLVAAVMPRLPFGFAYSDRDVVVSYLGYGLIAVLFVLPAVFGDRAGGLPRRVLANPFIAWMGMISYSFYLYHLVIAIELADGRALELLPGAPVLSLTLATFAVTTPVAAASYYLVERPFMRYKHRRGAGGRFGQRGGLAAGEPVRADSP